MATNAATTTTDNELPMIARIARIAAPTILRIARERHPELFAGQNGPESDRVGLSRTESERERG
jgi:hypothetical protein